MDMESLKELQDLSMNLAIKNGIRDTLREHLADIPGHEDLLADVVNTCVHMYETRMYLEPSEKYLLVKVGVQLLALAHCGCLGFFYIIPGAAIMEQNVV